MYKVKQNYFVYNVSGQTRNSQCITIRYSKQKHKTHRKFKKPTLKQKPTL